MLNLSRIENVLEVKKWMVVAYGKNELNDVINSIFTKWRLGGFGNKLFICVFKLFLFVFYAH